MHIAPYKVSDHLRTPQLQPRPTHAPRLDTTECKRPGIEVEGGTRVQPGESKVQPASESETAWTSART
eukprot:1381861-Alexandrium_andersonii.AAC.1